MCQKCTCCVWSQLDWNPTLCRNSPTSALPFFSVFSLDVPWQHGSLKKKKTYKNVLNSYLRWSDWCWCKGKYVMVVSRGLTSREIWWKTTREQQISEPRCRTAERHAWVLLKSMEQWTCSFSKYIIRIEYIVMYLSVKVLSGGSRSSWRSIEDWGTFLLLASEK